MTKETFITKGQSENQKIELQFKLGNYWVWEKNIKQWTIHNRNPRGKLGKIISANQKVSRWETTRAMLSSNSFILRHTYGYIEGLR